MKKIKNWEQEEIEYVKNNYYTSSVKDIAKALNKPNNSVYYVVMQLGLKKQEHKPWTEEENNYLINNYMKTSEELSKTLDRTVASINTQRDRLGLSKTKPWSDEEVDYLKNNYDKILYSEIAKLLNRTESAIRVKCNELRLVQKDEWSEEEVEFLMENYFTMTNRELAGILNRTENAVHVKGSKLGLKKYPYTCDYHYFDVIDTEEKAYWLGFLTADGWINRNEDSKSCVTGIELQYGDIGHLRKFNKSIAGNYKITDRWRECAINNNKKSHTCVLRIFSVVMYNSLVKLGFTNNKSFDGELQEINDELARHYVRGYFDGNGCFGYAGSGLYISFSTASENINEGLIKIISKENIKISKYSYVNEYGTTMYRPGIHRNGEKIKFLDWIYKDCNIYLDRKYKKYLKVKSELSTREPRQPEMVG